MRPFIMMQLAPRLSIAPNATQFRGRVTLSNRTVQSVCTGERIHEDSALDGEQRRVPDIYPYHANRFSQGREIGSSIANYANTMDSVASGREYLV